LIRIPAFIAAAAPLAKVHAAGRSHPELIEGHIIERFLGFILLTK